MNPDEDEEVPNPGMQYKEETERIYLIRFQVF